MARLVREPIPVAPLLDEVRGDRDGAVALFVGTVRDSNAGRRVKHLEYDAYGSMAEREMARIEEEVVARFEVSRIVVVHRIGRLEIGEVSVAVAVSAPHRAPAIEACRYAIDTLKRTVPIWKKEFFEGGEIWIEGGGDGPPA